MILRTENFRCDRCARLLVTGFALRQYCPMARVTTTKRSPANGSTLGLEDYTVASHVRKAFASLPETDRLSRQIELANRIILLLADSAPTGIDQHQARLLRAELLLGILQAPVERPDTPLSASCLMTGTRQDPSLVSQLRKEFLSADRVDILCSFIKWGGVRILEESLRKHTDGGRPLRVRQAFALISTNPMKSGSRRACAGWRISTLSTNCGPCWRLCLQVTLTHFGSHMAKRPSAFCLCCISRCGHASGVRGVLPKVFGGFAPIQPCLVNSASCWRANSNSWTRFPPSWL